MNQQDPFAVLGGRLYEEEQDPFAALGGRAVVEETTQSVVKEAPQTTLGGLAIAAGRGLLSGAAGAFGTVQDLLGLATNSALNAITGGDVSYAEAKDRLGSQGLPGEQARTQVTYNALDVLNDPNASFLDRLMAANALGDEDVAAPPAFLPNPTDIKNFVDRYTDNRFQPETAAEQIVEAGAEALGFGLPLGLTAPASMLAGASGGSAAEALRLAGVGPLGQVVGAIGAGTIAPSALRLAGGALTEGAKTIAGQQGVGEAVSRTAARALQETPSAVGSEQLNRSVINAATQEGIQLPPGAISNNRTLQFLQSVVDESAAAGSAPDIAAQKASDAFIKSFKQALDNVSENAVATKLELGQQVQEGLNSARNVARGSTSQLYDYAETLIPTEANISSKPLVQKADTLLKNFGRFQSPEERAAANVVKDLRDSFVDASGKPIDISAAEIQKLKRSLNNIIDYEVVGGPRELLKSLQRTSKDMLESVGKENPRWYEAFQRAEKSHGQNAEIFGNKRIAAAIRSNRPEALLNLGNDVSGIRAVESALSKLPEGEQAIQQFKRAKLEDMLLGKVVDASSDTAKYGQAKRAFSDPKQRDVLKELLGDEQFAKINRLKDIAGAISEGNARFANFSKTAARGSDIAHGLTVLHQVGLFLKTLDPSYLLVAGVTRQAPRVAANILFDKGFTDQLIRMAESSRANDPSAFLKALQGSATTLDEIINQSGSQLQNPAISQ